jgi:dihydropteroate synthase
VQLFGVVNASPDSLNTDSIVTDATSALARARSLLAQGCVGIDLGGQGSTDVATIVEPAIEQERLEGVLPALASLGVPISIDTWKPEVADWALSHGATVLNAADGLQAPGMHEVAAAHGCQVVLPFLNGPDPRSLRHTEGDPVTAMELWFAAAIERADRHGIAERLVLDPGTGFAPLAWAWDSRYHYQKHVYSNLDRLRRFGLPLYVALPWKDTEQHRELMEIVVAAEVDYGRVHVPAQVRAAEQRLAARTGSTSGSTPGAAT